MTEAALSLREPRAALNPWVVAAAVVVPTFMEVLDTTIAVVALRYIAGGLSATVIDGEWVITSYLAANAIILPMTGWLTTRFGRRNYFLASIFVFTVGSALCGMATSLSQLILFRVVQGLAGGGLQPSSQAVLLDAFPVEKQGTAMTLFCRGCSDRAGCRSQPWAAGSRTIIPGGGSSTSTFRSVFLPSLPAIRWSTTRRLSHRRARGTKEATLAL